MPADYRDDTTPDDIRSGDQCAIVCACGHSLVPAWRRLPQEQQFTPLRDLRSKMVCNRCGLRRPSIIIKGHFDTSSHLKELWRWPPNLRS